MPEYNIYAIGDSHAGTFSPYTHTIPAGPETMYKMGSQDPNYFQNLIDYLISVNQLSRDGMWILCFGEIDVRCHIYNQIVEKQRDEDEVIKTLVERYMENVKSIHTDIAIMSVVPPTEVENIRRDFTYILNSPYPFIGSDTDRSRYTRKVNAELRRVCNELGILFLDVYSLYANEEGFLPEEFADKDSVHIYNRNLVPMVLEGVPQIERFRN